MFNPKQTGAPKLKIISLLCQCHPIAGFVYDRAELVAGELTVTIRPRKGAAPRCGRCGRKGPCYDTKPFARRYAFVPLWGYAVWFVYRMRRVMCRRCGVTTEQVPWSSGGKQRQCDAYQVFLARWAKRLSWSEVARVFGTSWQVVYASVQYVVAYGLLHRKLSGISAIGVDEIAVWAGHKYMTVVYQIDRGMRRLLWVGKDRTEETLSAFFTMLGETQTAGLRYVVSDMWRPYLNVIADKANGALCILDRFHVVAKLNEAVDEVRRKEVRKLAIQGYEPVLTKTRFCFLKRKERHTPKQKQTLNSVLRYNLQTVRAYLLKEAFDAFWTYLSPIWAGWFLDKWCTRAMRSQLAPIKKFAKTLRSHRGLLLNWFAARRDIALGCVEGFNANAKLAIRKARGFRTERVLKIALYHQLAQLPEPPSTHTFT